MSKRSTPISLSPIQNHIISCLKNAESLRYSQMQPENIPNDLFNYHLQFLVKKGLVAKNTFHYSLTESGIKHVADPIIFDHQFKTASLFKVNVLTVVSRIKNGKIEILNQKRTRHPSLGKIGVPGGVVLKGEATEKAASRKLLAETGLKAEFKILGIERRMMYTKNELFSDVLFPIAYSTNATGELLAKTEFGENKWVSITQAIKNESALFDSIPSLKKVLLAIKNKKIKTLPFFYSEITQAK